MNTNNLRTFLQGDGIWILTAIAVLLSDQGLAKQFLASTLLCRWFLCRYCFNCERTRYPKSSRLVPSTLWY